jgi:hypothetical protein
LRGPLQAEITTIITTSARSNLKRRFFMIITFRDLFKPIKRLKPGDIVKALPMLPVTAALA